GWLQNMGRLAQDMAQPIAARFAWEQLSLIERKVLHHALTLATTDGVMRDLLFKLTHLSAEEFADAVVTLQQHLLMVEEQVLVKTGRAVTGAAAAKKLPSELTIKLGVPKEILPVLVQVEREIYTPKQDRSNLKLEQILATIDVNKVYQIGTRYGFMLNDYFTRTDPRARLAGQLVQPDVLYYAWDQLKGTARKLCKWIVEAGGSVSMNAAREFSGYDNPTLAASITVLEEYALVFDTFVEHERRLFIPRELLKNLKKVIEQGDTGEAPDEVGLVPLERPPVAIHQGGAPALYDLTMIIGASFQQNMEPTQAGYIPKRVVNKLAPQMQMKPRLATYEQDNLNVDMLYTIASELNLLKLSRSEEASKPRYVEAKALREWSSKSEQEMAHDLLEYWPKSRQWVDIAGVNYQSQQYDSLYYMNFESGRRELLAYLRTCEPGRWYSVSSLLKTIKHEKPYLLRNQSYHTGVTGYRNAKTVLMKWFEVDGEILTGLLSSSLYEMGIVAVGFEQHSSNGSQPANPVAFMVTELGAAALGSKKDAKRVAEEAADYAGGHERKRALIVQPNFELMLLQPDMPTLYRLLPFAQIVQVGMVSRLNLTKTSLLRGLEQGRNIDQILKILTECSQNELPQNVVYTLKDWARAYKEVSISQVYLLETPSEVMGDDLAAMEKLKNYGLRRLGPCTFITGNDTNIQELRRLLEKEGIVTRAHGEFLTQKASSPGYSRWR
ncbi:MAG TPA: helicase-associated domain-containing protein, partial [Ktedonobacteraceae bacterium]|nr:helicase-associated domain-containing protein [Ktedonobacteraceae bacterium]